MRAANFVEETTTSIAGTGGNGAVTLSAVTGRPRFSTVFGTQATTIRYVIEDTTTGKFETGVGSVASNVLTRTRPQVTWDGTTYDDSTPSPIAFGSTPTSGNVRIRMSATAESQFPALPGNNTSIGSDPWRDYPMSASFKTAGSGNGGTLTAGTEYYAAYELPMSGVLSGFQIDVTTAVASSGIKSALYTCGSNGLPLAKLVDFPIVDSSTTGIKTNDNPSGWTPAGGIYLTPGWYFFGFISDAAVGMRGTTGQSLHLRTPLSRVSAYGYAGVCSLGGQSYTTGLPSSPAPTSLINSGSTALGNVFVGLKVVP